MVRRAYIVSAILLMGTLAHADEQRPGAPSPRSLRPVTSQALRPVPSSGVYQSVWTDQMPEAGVIQASHVDPPAGPAENAADGSSIVTTPFFELTQPTDEASTSESGFASSETNQLFSRLAVWTVIVLCLCVLTVLALRRWQRGQGMLPSSRGNAKILETLALGPGRAVALVQLGQHQAFVGTDSGGISTIVLAPPAFDDAFDAAALSDLPENPEARTASAPAVRTLGFPGTFNT